MKTPNLWQLTVLETPTGRFVKGTVVQKAIGKTGSSTVLGHFFSVLRSFGRKPLAHAIINVCAAQANFQTTTDAFGSFQIMLPLSAQGTVRCFVGRIELPYPNLEHYQSYFGSEASHFDVISDLDDTAILSHTASTWKRLFTIALLLPNSRKAIKFTSSFLNTLHQKGAQTYFVSRSEGNLFVLLASALRAVNIPPGALFFAPYTTLFGLFNKHRKTDFKKNQIAEILQLSGQKKFVLLGDDTQEDLEIYHDIHLQFPNRILKIFIRQTKNKPKQHIAQRVHFLTNTGLNILYFTPENHGKNQAETLLNSHAP